MEKKQVKTSQLKNKLLPYVSAMGVVFLLTFFIYKFLKFVKQQDTSLQLQNDSLQQQVVNQQAETANPVERLDKRQKFAQRWAKMGTKKVNETIADAIALAVALRVTPKDNYKFTLPLLGIKSDLFNISAMFEDEAEAIRISKRYPGSWQALTEAYYTFATKTRNLNDDLLKYLSKSDLNEIRKSHKAKGFVNI